MDTCTCLHDFADHVPDDDGTPCFYWYPVHPGGPCQCTDFTPQQPRPRVLYGRKK